MPTRTSRSSPLWPSLSFLLLAGLLAELWLTGGASRGSVLGQTFSRFTAWAVLVIVILFADRPRLGSVRPVVLLLGAITALPLLQLVPLPPTVWQALPGRELVTSVARCAGSGDAWRPLSMSPGSTINALFSLVIAVAALVLGAGLRERERGWLPALLLLLVAASALAGLIQFSGNRFSQPLINYTGDVSGTFANRNHFALFLALGTLMIPAWALAGNGRLPWRAPFAAGLGLLLLLTVLASGSRTGMVLVSLALIAGLLVVREKLRRAVAGLPRWLLPVTIGVIVAAIVLAVVLGRAVSFDRLVGTDIGQDMRVRGLDTVITMVGTYFPAGTGFGTFNQMFRIHEPFDLLKPTYFNQAHNDFLGVILDAGLPGLLVLLSALGWWVWTSIAVWKTPANDSVELGRLGSAAIALVLAASTVDYPARTPLIMACTTVAACLLVWGTDKRRADAKPAVF